MTALTTFNFFAGDPAAVRERISQRPNIAREVQYYKENISNIKSIDDLINDRQIYATVMRAYGLEDMAYAKGFMKKLLEGGVDDQESMANKLTDTRYKKLAEDFNFVRHGEVTTVFEKIQSGVIDNLYTQRIEADAGLQNGGARLAIYFKRKSDEITNSYSILADTALLKFVQTTFNLPETMSLLPIEKQAAMLEEKLDIKDLQDTEFVDDLVTQFLSLWDISNPQTINVPPLIAPPSGQLGISESMLSSILSVKFFN